MYENGAWEPKDGRQRASLLKPERLPSSDTCIVNDPTGTPLAVRASPRGTKVGELSNGTEVEVLQFDRDDRNRRWARIRSNAWVFANYLDCARR
ncbi:hypothetical protein BB934_45680 (plasmid) [Microvirga ossetica]|uniref:SH3b domain-containing protein n=1 Tax=Microvirga ossetica TaxID=1882682 RepID=A0A1B2F020_9HYPH|nr:hypothetical protein BB934_45680 [Microvirga ossetica]